jgi:hypothetical protein
MLRRSSTWRKVFPPEFVRSFLDRLGYPVGPAGPDALMIESAAKHRLADEYDAAQERGEVAPAKGGYTGH